MIRALLVDDEEPARLRLRGLLADHPDVEILGEAEDGEEALRQIAATRPDLVFLDIQMPGRTGLEVVAALQPPRPRIIFCTAYDRYAVRAFEHHAVDYLLKPLNRDRLDRAVRRVREWIGDRDRQRREWESASRTQARLLPQELPPCNTLDYCGSCRTALEVGGDYYDFLPIDGDRLGIVLGDVSGKGMHAGLLMASLQAQVHSRVPARGGQPEILLGEINRQMFSSTHPDKYATFFYGLYDDRTRRLEYSNAGHPPPLVLRAGEPAAGRDRVVPLHATGPPLGLLEEAEYGRESVDLRIGDTLLAFTDGLTEARDSGQREFGADRLIAQVNDRGHRSPEEWRDRIFRAVDRFRGPVPQQDDMTLVVARVR